jgi:hypothetical protein
MNVVLFLGADYKGAELTTGCFCIGQTIAIMVIEFL